MTDICLNMDELIDELEKEMVSNLDIIDCPLQHVFTPGLYSRSIIMPAGSLITSKIHNTCHQFIVSKGKALVKVNDSQWEAIEAPYIGITQPGTRRVLYIEEDCIWTTLHPVDIQPENESEEAIMQAVEKIEDLILIKRDNPLLNNNKIENI